MFGICSREFIRIANPSTNSIVKFLPAFPRNSIHCDPDRQVRSVSLGFDPVEGKHKILESLSILECRHGSVERMKHRVVTVGEEYTKWRSVDGPRINHRDRGEKTGQEICVDGVIYYITVIDSDSGALEERERCLVAFDVRSERFQVVKFSMKGRFDYAPSPCRFVEFEGKVAIVDYPFSNKDSDLVHTIDLWVLEDFQNQDWSLKFSDFPSLMKTKERQYVLVGTTFSGELVFALFEEDRTSYPFYKSHREKKNVIFLVLLGYEDWRLLEQWSSSFTWISNDW